MPTYQVQGSIAAAATKTPLVLTGGTTRRFRLIDFTISASGTPGSDAGAEVQLKRTTAAGTTTSVTPAPADALEAACSTTAGSNASVEPTYTGIPLHDVFFNPRNTVRWVAYDQLAQLVSDLTASHGIGFEMTAAGGVGGNVLVQAAFVE